MREHDRDGGPGGRRGCQRVDGGARRHRRGESSASIRASASTRIGSTSGVSSCSTPKPPGSRTSSRCSRTLFSPPSACTVCLKRPACSAQASTDGRAASLDRRDGRRRRPFGGGATGRRVRISFSRNGRSQDCAPRPAKRSLRLLFRRRQGRRGERGPPRHSRSVSGGATP